jgi:hypothetical protein
VGGVFLAEPAEFLDLGPVRMLALVLGGGIVPALAGSASQGDNLSHFTTYYIKYFL